MKIVIHCKTLVLMFCRNWKNKFNSLEGTDFVWIKLKTVYISNYVHLGKKCNNPKQHCKLNIIKKVTIGSVLLNNTTKKSTNCLQE